MKKTLIYLQSEEDDYYLEKIQKLANEKWALFALGKVGLSEECKQVNKSLKKPKGALKRESSSMEEDHHHEIENKNEKQKKKKMMSLGNKVECRPVVVNEVTERLKEFIKNKMNGSDIKLVIQKRLFVSDMKNNQNRLSMPFNQVETHDFLTPEEREILNRHDETCTTTKLGIEVGLLGPTLQIYDRRIELKIWDMQKTHNYVLITNWYNFVMDHKNILKEGANIQVWAYRKNQQLCFAVARVDHKAKVEEIHYDVNDIDSLDLIAN